MSGARITGTGIALPDRVVTNDDFAKYLDTSDEWITERTGIRERRVGGTTGELSVIAGRNALQAAGLSGADIDLVILATSTPDRSMPPTSAWIQNELAIAGGAMDVNVACSGFVYAMSAAHGMIKSAGLRNVLVVGADTLSRITDQQDRTTAVLFADGAGAAVLSASDDDALLATDLDSDGSTTNILLCESGGKIQMVGKEVYRQAVKMCVQSITETCERAHIKPEQIDLFVAHQANLRIIDAVTQRVGIDREKAPVVLDHTGNTSAASIPLALHHAVENGRVKPSDIVMFCGFGAGMTIATQIWRWNP